MLPGQLQPFKTNWRQAEEKADVIAALRNLTSYDCCMVKWVYWGGVGVLQF